MNPLCKYCPYSAACLVNAFTPWGRRGAEYPYLWRNTAGYVAVCYFVDDVDGPTYGPSLSQKVAFFIPEEVGREYENSV